MAEMITEKELELARVIAELQVNMKSLTDVVKRLEDTNEGTVERKGMKERIALAEENIRLHKEAWIKNESTLKEMEGRINKTLQEAFTEVKTEFNSRINILSEDLKTQKTFIAKFQPYANVITWAVTLLAGYILLQIVSGKMALVVR